MWNLNASLLVRVTINLLVLFKVEFSSKYGYAYSRARFLLGYCAARYFTLYGACVPKRFCLYEIYSFSTIQQLEEDYVQIQYAYGASKKTVLFNHVLRNVLIPIIYNFRIIYSKFSWRSVYYGNSIFMARSWFTWGKCYFRFDYQLLWQLHYYHPSC